MVGVVARSRKAAKSFGVSDAKVIRHWAMVEALLTPGFFAMPQVRQHFSVAYGDPDTKARDLIQLVKVDFQEFGRGAEIWW